jgi:hypothetical protein
VRKLRLRGLPRLSFFVLEWIERYFDDNDEENWTRAQQYRLSFLDSVISDQVYLSTHRISWEASNAMPWAERLAAVRKFQKIDGERAKALKM